MANPRPTLNRYVRLLRPALLVVAAGLAAGFALWDHDYPQHVVTWMRTGEIYRHYAWLLLRYETGAVVGALLLWGLGVFGRRRLAPHAQTEFWSPGEAHPLAIAAREQAGLFRILFPMPIILVRYGWHPFGMVPGSAFWTYLLVPPLAIVTAGTLAYLIESLYAGSTIPPLLHRHLSSRRLVWLLIVVYLFTFGALSLGRHLSFESHALDLATMSQTAWNTAHGRPLEYTPLLEEATTAAPPIASRLTSGKLELIFLVIAPFYRLRSDPALLILLQTLALGLSAWPLYLTLRRLLDADRPALVLTAAYLVYLPLHYVNVADFHPSALIPFFLSWAMYALTTGRVRLYIVAAGGALLCRVDAALVLAGLGILLLLREQWGWGGATLAAGVGWFLADFFVVVPWAEAWYGPDPLGLVSQRFGQYGSGPIEIVVGMAGRPIEVLGLLTEREKIQTGFDLMMPLGGLPLVAPLWLLPILPLAFVNLLADSAWQGTVQAHYFAPILPFLFVAAGIAIRRISLRRGETGRWRDGLAFYALTSALLVAFFFSPFPLGRNFRPNDYWTRSPHHEAIRQVISQVKPESALSGQSDLLPHVAHRERLYLFPSGIGEADQILLDLDNAAERAPLDYFAFFEIVDELLDNPAYGLVAWHNGVILLERGAPHRPARVRTLRAEYEAGLYRVQWHGHTAPGRLEAGTLRPVEVCFENTSTQGWRSTDWYPIFLSYHWLSEEGQVVEWDGERTSLGTTIYPGQQTCLQIPVIVPDTPGEYVLQFDLVREHRYWFSERGAEPLAIRVRVFGG